MFRSTTLRVVLCGILAMTFAQDSVAADSEEKAGVLRILSESFEPFLYVNELGAPAGFEYEILASFAASEGLGIEVVWTSFAEAIDALERGDGDVIASTMTITGERKERLDFSVPYFSTRVVLVQRSGTGLNTPASLADKTVLTIAGTTYEQTLKALGGLNIIYAETEEEMYARLSRGDADALATDSANFLWVGRDFPGLETGQVLSDRQFYGFAFRKGDPLRRRLDDHIEKLIADGTFWTYLQEAFGDVVAGHIDDLKKDFLAETE